MSRRLLPSTSHRHHHHHHRRIQSAASSCDPQQQQQQGTLYGQPKYYRNSFQNNGETTIDTGLSDGTFTEYDCQDGYHYPSHHHHHHNNPPPYQNQENDLCYTSEYTDDDSGSTRIPHYENDMDDDDDSCRQLSTRNTNAYSSERHFVRRGRDKVIPVPHKDPLRAYPVDSRVYQEIQQQISQVVCDVSPPPPVPPARHPPSAPSDLRPQSSMSSGVTSSAVVVDGCGGKCQTFENVCYFFLQLVFMMGILIGSSLSIAGWVLRKSAARNLQVLVYIGMMVAVVSGLLLGIQWNARVTAKRRKLAVRNAKIRAPIPMETLMHHPRGLVVVQQQQLQQQQPLVVAQDGQRVIPQIMRPLPPTDEQGVPWWRRRDI